MATWACLAGAALALVPAIAWLPAGPASAATFEHDGIMFHYEVRGAGPWLLVVHGNGGDAAAMRHQVDYFSRHYRVVAMDGRDHGQSGDSPVPLTFEAMADDLSALLSHLHAGRACVLGWSDGAIEGLLLAMRHPEQVRAIAAMAPNLDPAGLVDPPPPAAPGEAGVRAPTRAGRVEALDRDQPHIDPSGLETIRVPTLVLAGEFDAIRAEHILLIHAHIPGSELAIFNGATHMIPVEDPKRFNQRVASFFAGAGHGCH